MKAPWLDRLERRIGFLAVPGLASFIVGMNAAVWLLALLRPEFPTLLTLDPGLVMQGQVWRVFTFLFIPPAMSPIWMFFWLFLLYSYASALEHEWGDFHFTLFYAVGAAATVLASLAVRAGVSNLTLNTTIFLAFAALYPDFELMLFFILPVKVKWLAWLAWAGLAWGFLMGDAAVRISLIAGLTNYALFFGPRHWDRLQLKIHHLRNRGKFG